MLYSRKILSSIIDVVIIIPGLIILNAIVCYPIIFFCKNEGIQTLLLIFPILILIYLIPLFFVKKDSIKGNRSIGKKIMRLYIYDEENNIVEFILTPNTPEFRPDISYAIRKRDLFEIGFKCQSVLKFAE